MRRVWSIVGPAGYVLAVLVLFQFACVRMAVGFYEQSAVKNLPQLGMAFSGKTIQAENHKAVGTPVRIKIPSIRVNALVQPVGLLPDGAMGVPKLSKDTAWYKLGPKPGEKGSAVISGHVSWWYGAYSVFKNLKSLKPGDKITVQDVNGTVTSFVVRSSRTYDQKDDASDVFFSNDDKSHLNLVTCAGVWNRATQLYTKRLVVFADKIEE